VRSQARDEIHGLDPVTEPGIGRIGRSDVLALAALTALGVGLPLWMALTAGAVGIPSNDDWVYMRAASSLYANGIVDMAGHTASVVGQLVLVQPILWLAGGNTWAFMAFGLCSALLGIAAGYLLARRFVGTGAAIMVVLLIEVFPGFARESVGFMTDVPAFSLGLVCLLLGTKWLQEGGSRLTLAASIGVGLLAVSVREFAIAAPVAILVAAWARNRAHERPLLIGLSGMLVAGIAGLTAVAASTAGHATPSPRPDHLLFIGPAFTTFAAAVLPATLLYVGRRMTTLTAQQMLLGAGLACVVVIQPDGSLVGNLWTADGSLGNQVLNGFRYPVIGAVSWALSLQIALFAGILVAALVIQWAQSNLSGRKSFTRFWEVALRVARRSEAPLVVFLVVYAAELVVFASLGTLFDRYLYPIIPVAAILLLRTPDRRPFQLTRSHAFSHLAVAWLAISAFLLAANSFAYDAARYREGSDAVAMGYRANTIDAGYEWVGSHATDPPTPGAVLHGWMWYDEVLASSQPCAVVSNGPSKDDAMTLIRVKPDAYRQYLWFGPAQSLYLYGVPAAGCPMRPVSPPSQ